MLSPALLAGILLDSHGRHLKEFCGVTNCLDQQLGRVISRADGSARSKPNDLLRDFQEEVPGYLNNKKICAALGDLALQPGLDNLNDNLSRCYSELVRMNMIGEAELNLLETWIADIEQIAGAQNS